MNKYRCNKYNLQSMLFIIFYVFDISNNNFIIKVDISVKFNFT